MAVLRGARAAGDGKRLGADFGQDRPVTASGGADAPHRHIASPRRYLIADEVGLGKTIEAALILRELASRGELTRALMVVPAAS